MKYSTLLKLSVGCQQSELFAWKPEAVRLRPSGLPGESSAHRGRHRKKLVTRMLGAQLKTREIQSEKQVNESENGKAGRLAQGLSEALVG